MDRDAQLPTRSLPGERPARAADLYPVALSRDLVATAAQSGEVLSKLLDRPQLSARISQIAAGLGADDRARFEANLGSFVLIADAALTVLDYDLLGTGWGGWGDGGCNYPENRQGYQQRAYRPDFDRKSQPRRDRSQASLGAALEGVLAAKDPAGALDAAVIDSFITQLGISRAVTAEWKPTSSAVAKALDQELFIPLRALADATLHLDHRGVSPRGHQPKELDRLARIAVEEMAQHVVEGDFDEWRFSHPLGKLQLSSLSAEQLAAYRAPLSVERVSQSGRKLTSRDEQGTGLFWVTKIGGPSHGFDMLSQCLLGLLANARNGAIVVDEQGWPDAARSVLRLLPTTDGDSVLYLEMLQVDFPHDRFGRSTVAREELRLTIVEHAAEKARAMGVRLVLAPSKYETQQKWADILGLRSESKDLELVLHPSAGVFEASDSLLGEHHAPQTQEEIVVVPNGIPLKGLPLKQPLVIYP